MKVLVTGGAGFIGSHVVDRLIQEGHAVVVVDNLSTGKRKNLNRAARFCKLDIQSWQLEKLFRSERPNLVLHFAAQMDVRKSVENPIFDAQVNVLGLLNVLQQAVKYGVKKVVFASSGGAIYGEQEVHPAPESHVLRPLSPYGVSKLCGEQYLSYYQRVSGLEVVSLRFANVYGPRQDPTGEAGVVAIFTQKLLNKEQAIISGNGRQTRDFIYVEDVVDATLAVLGPKIHGIYNVGTGLETSINDLFKVLIAHTESTCQAVHGQVKTGEQIRSVIDSSKFRQELSWEPNTMLSDGLKKTVEYFRERIKKSNWAI